MNYRLYNNSIEEGDPSFEVPRLQGRPLIRASFVPTSLVRYTYYAFVFSLPLEKADIEIGGFTLARWLGFLVVAVTIAAAFLQKRRFRLLFPPSAFWLFAVYSLVYAALGYKAIVESGPETVVTAEVIQGIRTLLQLLLFFWISYNLLQYERIKKGTLLTLAASATIVALLQFLGLTGNITSQDRVAAFGANENLIADVLSLGLLIVVGLAYGQERNELKSRVLFWLFSGALAVMIVVTGSRGATIALFASLLVFFLHGKSLRAKLKTGSAVVLALGVLGWVSYAIEPVRERWERTYYEGDTATREVIFAAAWEMFLEKPLVGWGPTNHISELGSRLGRRSVMDTHNIYLWLLTETGLLGASFFLVGVWFCWHAAWRARRGMQGALPMSLMLFLLVVGAKGTIHTEKLFWLVLAYVVASSSSSLRSHRYPSSGQTEALLDQNRALTSYRIKVAASGNPQTRKTVLMEKSSPV